MKAISNIVCTEAWRTETGIRAVFTQAQGSRNLRRKDEWEEKAGRLLFFLKEGGEADIRVSFQ